MSALIEKIRQETRAGNFAKVKRLLSTNSRQFASLSKAEQNILLLAMINIQEPRLLFKNLGHELDEKNIIELGPDEFKHQIIIALAHMWFGSEALALRIARRLEQILTKKQMHFEIADQKRVIESISMVFDAQGKYEEIIKLKNFYPTKKTRETEHTDQYFYRKYCHALFNKNGASKRIIKEVEKIRNNTTEVLPKILLFCDLCILKKAAKELSYTEIVKLMMKEKLLKQVADKKLKIPWFQLILTRAQLEKKNLTKAKKHLILYYQQSILPVDRVYALTLFYYHFPNQLSLGENIYLWAYNGKNNKKTVVTSDSTYISLIKKHISQGDVWFISDNTITPQYYKKINFPKTFIDLEAGLVRTNNKTIILTKKRIEFLTLVISKGSFGCAEIDLISKIYPDNLAHSFFSESESIKNISIQLKKAGFPIKRHKGFYYFDLAKNNFDIILPISLEHSGVHTFCAKTLNTFKSADLITLLGVRKTTAFKLLKDWKKNNKVKQISTNQYMFIPSA